MPENVQSEAEIRTALLKEYNLEIGAGLGGGLAGKIWRMGLMDYSARDENIDRCLKGFRDLRNR